MRIDHWTSFPARGRRGSVIVAMLAAMLSPGLAHAEVKVRGATTVAYGLINPNKAKVEQLAKTELSVLPSSTGHGLADLAEGQADIAMLADPLESAAGALNAKDTGPRSILTDLSSQHRGRCLRPVHRSSEQSRHEAHQGCNLPRFIRAQIKNWSELGGATIAGAARRRADQFALSPDQGCAGDFLFSRHASRSEHQSVRHHRRAGARRHRQHFDRARRARARASSRFWRPRSKTPLQLYLAFRKDAPDEVLRVVDAPQEIAQAMTISPRRSARRCAA